MKEKVLLGMSGGVDSSTAAILLKNQGYEVIGITFNMFNSESNTYEDAKKVCEKLKIKHITENIESDFKKCVIDNFISEYSICSTPNPCIECNKYIKFKKMYEIAKSLGINYIATGHYAKIEYDEKYKQKVIKKSNSITKDQTYFLYSIDKEILDHIIFPLGDFDDKSKIREIAEEAGLEVSKKPDSQDICFIKNNDYIKFLEDSGLKKDKGNIVDKNENVLGKHEGLYKYTIGQRKGLGIAYKHPLYVIGFNKEKNEVIVGEEKDLYSKEVLVENYNFLTDNIKDNMEVYAKIRYSQKSNKATLKILSKDELLLVFEEPQRGKTKGQSAVFYDGDILIGGGKIK